MGWTSINPSYFDVNRRGTIGFDTLPCAFSIILRLYQLPFLCCNHSHLQRPCLAAHAMEFQQLLRQCLLPNGRQAEREILKLQRDQVRGKHGSNGARGKLKNLPGISHGNLDILIRIVFPFDQVWELSGFSVGFLWCWEVCWIDFVSGRIHMWY